ncbi:hypothetical protein [Nocardiopsis sp. L17-MgMaSL7]|uniref:hypothetical protein n=1 Tax=Nocardiopsis sp. L17-MgMaSL7 TaxID=1938893 RepID=UPI000D71DA43|nr:hypothetical protein [Nocardiopsis sp. L17-MgMaSL7]PWV45514.1 hypothetical protein BDW27_11775 [Nocardiopsis sp. L17-MgMaSL7]
MEPPQLTLSEDGQALLLEAGGRDFSEVGEQWLLDPLTGEELPRLVPVDLYPNEAMLLHTEGSPNADADAPRLVPVPGAVVVTEEHDLSVRAVGLI